MFIGLNLIAYEDNMQCLNLNQLIKQVNCLFSIVYPNTIFSETFSIKVLWFRLYFLLLRCHILTGSSNWAKVGWTYIHKGVTVRFGFDAIRTSQLPNVCQEQSNGDAPWDVSYIQSLSAHSISAMS